MAPNFLSKFVKAATTNTNDGKTDPGRSASRDHSSKPLKYRTPSHDTTSSTSPRSSFQIGISTLTRGASRNRAASSPATAKHIDASLHRKVESADTVPPIPALPDSLKAAPATGTRARRNSIISIVFGGRRNHNSDIIPQPEPSLSAPYDDAGIPTVITVASASSESVTTNISSQFGVTIIPPSPLIYSSSSLQSTHSASVDDFQFPAAVVQAPTESEFIGQERRIENTAAPAAETVTTTTASVLVSLFGSRARTSSISSAISGIIGPDKPSGVDINRASQGLGGITTAPTPITAPGPPLPPSSSKTSMALTASQTLAPGHEVQRKTSSRSLTNVPAPINVSDHTTKHAAQGVRAATTADGDTNTDTMTAIVDSPTALKTEFIVTPSSSPTNSNSIRNRAASASAAQSFSNGGFSLLLSPKKGGDDDTASIISTTSKSPKDKDDNKKRLFKRSTSRKPTGLASAIAATGMAMANPSISAIHSAQMNEAAAAIQNGGSIILGNSKDSAVTSKGHPPGTAPYMSKSPSNSGAFSAGQRSATTIASMRPPKSPNSTGRKVSGGSAGKSPMLGSYSVTSDGSRRHHRRPSVSAYSDATSAGGLSVGGLGSEYYSGNESDARSRGSRRSAMSENSGSESDSDEDSSDDDVLDGLDLDDQDMPVTGFAVASNKRNADFHELFSTVPEGDYLIEDYGCALQREILIQGRLYISENHICFHANIFGWVTDLSIPIDEITSVEKKMTAFVIPNAIQITTRQARYTFASFLSRDTTYDVIYNIWRLARPDDIHSMGESLDGAGASGSIIYGSADGVIKMAGAEGGVGAGTGGTPKKVQRRATQCACGREGRHYTETAMEATFPGSPEMIHNLMFASGFIKDFFAVGQRLIDIQMADWMPAKEGSNLLTRNMSYIKPLNAPMGPKQTKCEIKDEMEHVNFDDYISILTTTRTPDVPSGGVFSVKTRTCIMWAGPVSTKVLVTTLVEWTGRSFIRGIIERSAIDGQKVYHAELEKAMRAYIQEHLSEFVPEGADAAEVAAEEELESKEAAAAAAGVHITGTIRETTTGGISKEEREKQREKERNQRAWQWVWDTLGGAFDVAAQSTKTAMDLVRDAWDQSSSTTILYFVITILVMSNMYTLMRMGKKEEVGRRKEMMKAGERERWVQSVVMTLWEDLAAGKKEALELHKRYSPAHDQGLHPPMTLAPPSELPSPAVAVTPGTWKGEVAQLHHTLEMVEERIKTIKQSLAEFEKLDGLD